jgi:hypothetical protein
MTPRSSLGVDDFPVAADPFGQGLNPVAGLTCLRQKLDAGRIGQRCPWATPEEKIILLERQDGLRWCR